MNFITIQSCSPWLKKELCKQNLTFNVASNSTKKNNLKTKTKFN